MSGNRNFFIGPPWWQNKIQERDASCLGNISGRKVYHPGFGFPLQIQSTKSVVGGSPPSSRSLVGVLAAMILTMHGHLNESLFNRYDKGRILEPWDQELLFQPCFG